MINLARSFFLAAPLVAAVVSHTRSAEACGGCFHRPTENTVVTGHRMAMSISPVQSVLWDQIEYAGAPQEFSWVLPVKAGARIEVAADAWFEALDAATSTTVQGPSSTCRSSDRETFGCASSARADSVASAEGNGGESGVTVVHAGTVGPYETVTLSTKDPKALTTWLDEHGYVLPDDIAPVVADYVAEGFDFIALRLIPGVGVQAMRPVRVVTPGAVLGLPLRMVAAGTGAETAVKLFVISEGRYQAKGFDNARIDPNRLVWNFDVSGSNYSSLRAAALAGNEGKTFLTSYARSRTLLSSYSDDLGTATFGISAPDFSFGRQARSIAGAYFYQGAINSKAFEGDVDACVAQAEEYGGSTSIVVDDCGDDGNCSQPKDGQIAASALACGPLDDLAVALLGLHPSDVWVTRLEANLPRAALSTDLMLEPAPSQGTVANRYIVTRAINESCPAVATLGGGSGGDSKGQGRPPGGIVGLALGMAVLGWFARRRQPLARA